MSHLTSVVPTRAQAVDIHVPKRAWPDPSARRVDAYNFFASCVNRQENGTMPSGRLDVWMYSLDEEKEAQSPRTRNLEKWICSELCSIWTKVVLRSIRCGLVC